MTTAVDVGAGIAGFVLVLLGVLSRELLRLRDRVTRLESRLNGR